MKRGIFFKKKVWEHPAGSTWVTIVIQLIQKSHTNPLMPLYQSHYQPCYTAGWSESAREMFTNTALRWNKTLPLCPCTPPACQLTRLCDAVEINHPGKPETHKQKAKMSNAVEKKMMWHLYSYAASCWNLVWLSKDTCAFYYASHTRMRLLLPTDGLSFRWSGLEHSSPHLELLGWYVATAVRIILPPDLQ